MEEVATFKGKLIKGVSSLCFSPSGKYLIASCIDDNHHIGIFDV